MNNDQDSIKILRDMANSIMENVTRNRNAELLFEQIGLAHVTEQELEKEIFRLKLKGENFSANFMRRLHRK